PARSEKFEAVDAAGTLDLMIVTEPWEDGLGLAPIASLLWWKCLEALDSFSTVRILMDVPIRSNRGVMGGIGKRHPGTKEGDGTVSVAIEERGGVRSEPRSPRSIRECASFWVKIADGIV